MKQTLFTIESSNFFNNSGYEGGVIKLENCINDGENWIYNSTFEANIAEGSGGAIFSENSKLGLISS
jgi:predicted outer membrane repeat protein